LQQAVQAAAVQLVAGQAGQAAASQQAVQAAAVQLVAGQAG
jgi:hypothetical protein